MEKFVISITNSGVRASFKTKKTETNKKSQKNTKNPIKKKSAK